MPDTVRIAAAGDVHCQPSKREETLQAFAGLDEQADLLLLAGDLTTHGEPEQAAVLAEACMPLSLPVLAVLGNHDWHSDRVDEVVPVWEDAGIRVLGLGPPRADHAVLDVGGVEVGVAGVKGFVGGFDRFRLPDWGEPELRAAYARASAEVDGLDAALRAIAHCPVRLALLHYAPLADTLVGEPPEIWTFLGSDRLAAPLTEHQPDLVLHGHAHHGTFEGRLGSVPVHNVSVPVMGRPFWVFELSGVERATTPIH